MKPSVHSDSSSSDNISFEFDFKHPPAKVWRAITDPTLLAKWLLPSVGFELAQGTQFQFKADPQPGWDGTVNCRMLEIEPQTKLRYSWVVGEIDTVITFILTPTASGCRLTLEQSGFKADQKQNLAGARYGWKMMSGKLIDLLAELT